jgi:hypothetical protein
MHKILFLLAFCLFCMGCFAPKKALTPEVIKQNEVSIAKATAKYYHALLVASYPRVYLDYYNNLTTIEFALYSAYARETEGGIVLDFKDTTQKTHCLAYYKDRTLHEPIGDWQIYDDKFRLKTKKHFEDNSETITDLDSLGHLKSVANYEDYYMRNQEYYFPTGEVEYSNEYSKTIYGETKCVETAFRINKTKKYIKTTIKTREYSKTTTGKEDETKICFDEKDNPIDCSKTTETVMNETKPEFPGGEIALMNFLATTILYPSIARENGAEGKVFIKFIVGKTGELEHIVPIRYPDIALMQETMRVMKLCPKWTPGQQNGKPVRVAYTLPVIFKLDLGCTEKRKKFSVLLCYEGTKNNREPARRSGQR